MSGHETPETDLRDSMPNANGPDGAAGDMGVSSERVGPTGPGQVSTDGLRDTSPAGEPKDRADADVPPEQAPGHPEENPEGATDRWKLVLDGMVEEGWLDPAEREGAKYPEVQKKSGSDLGIPSGPQGLIVQRALAGATNAPG